MTKESEMKALQDFIQSQNIAPERLAELSAQIVEEQKAATQVETTYVTRKMGGVSISSENAQQDKGGVEKEGSGASAEWLGKGMLQPDSSTSSANTQRDRSRSADSNRKGDIVDRQDVTGGTSGGGDHTIPNSAIKEAVRIIFEDSPAN